MKTFSAFSLWLLYRTQPPYQGLSVTTLIDKLLAEGKIRPLTYSKGLYMRVER